MRWLAQKRSWRACACSGKSCWQGRRPDASFALFRLYPAGQGTGGLQRPREAQNDAAVAAARNDADTAQSALDAANAALAELRAQTDPPAF